MIYLFISIFLFLFIIICSLMDIKVIKKILIIISCLFLITIMLIIGWNTPAEYNEYPDLHIYSVKSVAPVYTFEKNVVSVEWEIYLKQKY